ncbi:MAG: hypothetical protein RIT50_29 [Bacteroidota bacterium]|jgi:hypothetical protein
MVKWAIDKLEKYIPGKEKIYKSIYENLTAFTLTYKLVLPSC